MLLKISPKMPQINDLRRKPIWSIHFRWRVNLINYHMINDFYEALIAQEPHSNLKIT